MERTSKILYAMAGLIDDNQIPIDCFYILGFVFNKLKGANDDYVANKGILPAVFDVSIKAGSLQNNRGE